MNEDSFGAEAPLSPEYKDRHAGLVVFGILTVLMGCFWALMIPLMIFGQTMAARNGQPLTPLKMQIPSLMEYALFAVGTIWLGIGSTMARRWARALLVVVSWSWLVIGIGTIAAMAYMMPKIIAAGETAGATAAHGAQHMPPGAMQGVMTVMMCVFGVIFLVIPAIWAAFYGSRNVKATCEARDPVPGWTDACPLPVLALCLFLVFSAAMMLIMSVSGPWPMPLFGVFLTGIPAAAVMLVLAAIWAYAAWTLYKLEILGWWVTLIAMLVLTASMLLTFAHHNIADIYSHMNLPAAQIDQIQKLGIFNGNGMLWMSFCWMVPFLGYLLFVRRYFRAAA
jgi:hypothetical protein